jgi:hypothetical protein
MKVLILPDTPNWVIDRHTDIMIKKMPCEFTKRYFDRISLEEFINIANQNDIVHYQNPISPVHIPGLPYIKKPIIMSVRSHRWLDLARESQPYVYMHVITPALHKIFPDAEYIPNGIFEQFVPDHPFVVGFAGKANEYKGFHLIEEACKRAGAIFLPATGEIAPEEMIRYYKSIDLYVCASENEGHSTPVMECLAMNKPVITVDVGLPSTLNVHKVERTIESIQQGIERFYTWPQVKEFTWDNTAKKFYDLYMRLINSHDNS